ncbi:rRNA pseudouridine synthase [Streptomyces sp. XM4193]|uniref:pseudouridine synthase n=1 Tax=Streptomyces sp. XM4193 TaxID=2929782 RepID=UPI001FFB18E6|nr:pseudouridine synthase [Streptomyces sp. XM4193]MCK1799059.1 rRNA pseudouridine synthase [Streptomyces sp. XM4193]
MRSSGNDSNRNPRGGNRNPGGAGKGRDEQRKRRPRPEERRYDVGEGGPGQGPRGGAGQGERGRSDRSRDDRGRGGRSQGGRDGWSRDDRGRDDRGRDDRDRGGRDDRNRDDRDRDRDRGGAGGSGRPKPAYKAGGKPTGGPKGSGGPKGFGGPRGGKGQPGRKRTAPARPREYEAQIEERNRARHDKPIAKLPKTFGEVEGERLQKVLARAGMGSRRACEELIERARVEVNGQIVLEQGLRVDPEKDEIKVDGLTVATQSYLFFALNKPAGVVASMEDPDGRQCLGDYVQNRETRLFHVGRLDTETEGIILLTNHGELAHRLTHPRYHVRKTYLAAIQGPLPRELGKRLKDGIKLDDGYARADHFRVVENTGKNYLVEVSLHEGRKHIVRRMLAEAGFPVEKLVRTKFGPIPLGDQKSGWLRRMTNTEVGMLMNEVGL